MRAVIGAGWYIHHLTDRVIEIRKDDPVYRRFTGSDGFVRARIDPEMTRAEGIERAIVIAQRNDEALALRVSKQLLPSKHALAKFTGKAVQMERVFGTNEDIAQIGRKRA